MSSNTEYSLSLVYFTYRPGGFDMLCGSLMEQTYDNYELIVIDDLPDRNLVNYIEDCGIPLTYYGPSKEKCYPDTPFNQVNAVNSGLLQARGDIVILIEDYVWLRPNTLERWCQIFDEKGADTFITGVGEYWGHKKPEKIGPITVWNEPFDGDFTGCTHKGTWRPDVFEYFYSGMAMSTLEKLNGMNERLDYWNTWPCLVWPRVLSKIGIKFYTDDENMIDLIDHRHWTAEKESWWWINKTYSGPRTPQIEQKMLVDASKVKWCGYAPNCFNLKEDRRR